MSVAAFLWRKMSLKLERSQLGLPLAVYLSNFAFGAVLSWASGFSVPVLLGLVVGVVPATALWWMIQPTATVSESTAEIPVVPIEVALK